VNIKNLFYKDSIKQRYTKVKSNRQFSKRFNKIFLQIKKDIKNSNKTLNILDNKFKFNYKINDLKNFKKFKTIAIIGMGGSILGSEAIFKFLQRKVKKKIYFFNDLNEKKITDFRKKENFSKVLFIIISKSGNTIETLSNTFSLNILKKNSKNIILVSDKKNSLLYSLSKKLNLFYIEHKDTIGGRYSVLSEVGTVPAYLMGVNIFKLRSKILNCMKEKNKALLKSSTIKLANLMKSKKINNLIFLNYSLELEKFLYWYQQLIAESLGKNNFGFLPVISNVPKDHHSLLQLYLDGPRDKIFNIFSLESKTREKVTLKKSFGINSFLNKKKLGVIKKAQKNSLIKAFIKKKIPFREFKIKINNEEVLGELFSFFIIETIIIGKLLKINPFNQPAVEQVKKYTKHLLN
tara:strand:- start:675 stop:1892 length:1218 start_codon:yes stop_codon:yes gene_type:complete